MFGDSDLANRFGWRGKRICSPCFCIFYGSNEHGTQVFRAHNCSNQVGEENNIEIINKVSYTSGHSKWQTKIKQNIIMWILCRHFFFGVQYGKRKEKYYVTRSSALILFVNADFFLFAKLFLSCFALFVFPFSILSFSAIRIVIVACEYVGDCVCMEGWHCHDQPMRNHNREYEVHF